MQTWKLMGLETVQNNQMSQVFNKSEKEQNCWQPYSTAHMLGFSSEFTTIQKSFFSVETDTKTLSKAGMGNTCICWKCWMGNLFEECVSSQVRSIKRVITDYSEVNTLSRGGGLTEGCLQYTSLQICNAHGLWGVCPTPMSPFPFSKNFNLLEKFPHCKSG